MKCPVAKSKKQNRGAASEDGVSPASSPASGAVAAPVRDEGGKFVKGTSGNPAGKRKGTRNLITLERLNLELVMREYLGDPKNKKRALEAVDRMFSIIETGSDKEATAAMKIFFDKVLSAPKEQEDQGSGARAVTVIIENRTADDTGPPVRAILDGEYEEV